MRGSTIKTMSLLSGTDLTLILSVFIASAVESVEAVTIVLAAGTARHMRSSLQGALTALLSLSILIAIFGSTLTNLPREKIRFTIGILLLFFGLQWLRKAILRYGGVIPLHDEEKIFKEEVALASKVSTHSRLAVHDWFAFTMSYKGVFLEGIEVAFVVISFASVQQQSNPHALSQSVIAALAAALFAGMTGLAIHKPLTRVPENLMKFSVGVMLTVFGFFWTLEGVGITWSSEFALLWIAIILLASSFALIESVKKVKPTRRVNSSSKARDRLILSFLRFWYDFIIGDDWRMPAIVLLSLALGLVLGLEIALVAVGVATALIVAVISPR